LPHQESKEPHGRVNQKAPGIRQRLTKLELPQVVDHHQHIAQIVEEVGDRVIDILRGNVLIALCQWLGDVLVHHFVKSKDSTVKSFPGVGVVFVFGNRNATEQQRNRQHQGFDHGGFLHCEALLNQLTRRIKRHRQAGVCGV
jgi:hypothetical protein